MNKKGFTLVELLAVIIILSLLALLASTSVTKIVKDSKSDLYDTQIKLIKSAAEAWGADNLYELPETGTCKYLTLWDLKLYGLIDPEIKNPKTNETFSDELLIKISGSENNFGLNDITYEVDSNNVNNCEAVYPKICEITDDKNNDGIADIGDMITCSTESFYVISNDGEEISMLAKYNLFIHSTSEECDNMGNLCEVVATKLQNSERKGYDYGTGVFNTEAITFSNKYYWYDTNDNRYIIDTDYVSSGRKYPFVYGDYKDENGKYLNSIYPYVNAYEEYLRKENVKSAQATLISYEQLKELGCDEEKKTCASSKYDWVYSSSYWTGSSAKVNHYYDPVIFIVEKDKYETVILDYGPPPGIRPVVNISTFELKKLK